MVITLFGCFPESSFDLADDSRVPKFFDEIAEENDRDKISVSVDYYLTEAVFKIYLNNKKVNQVTGQRIGTRPYYLDDLSLGRKNDRPSYNVYDVDGVIEITEHREKNNIFHMNDDSRVEAAILAILEHDIQKK